MKRLIIILAFAILAALPVWSGSNPYILGYIGEPAGASCPASDTTPFTDSFDQGSNGDAPCDEYWSSLVTVNAFKSGSGSYFNKQSGALQAFMSLDYGSEPAAYRYKSKGSVSFATGRYVQVTIVTGLSTGTMSFGFYNSANDSDMDGVALKNAIMINTASNGGKAYFTATQYDSSGASSTLTQSGTAPDATGTDVYKLIFDDTTHVSVYVNGVKRVDNQTFTPNFGSNIKCFINAGLGTLGGSNITVAAGEFKWE